MPSYSRSRPAQPGAPPATSQAPGSGPAGLHSCRLPAAGRPRACAVPACAPQQAGATHPAVLGRDGSSRGLLSTPRSPPAALGSWPPKTRGGGKLSLSQQATFAEPNRQAGVHACADLGCSRFAQQPIPPRPHAQTAPAGCPRRIAAFGPRSCGLGPWPRAWSENPHRCDPPPNPRDHRRPGWERAGMAPHTALQVRHTPRQRERSRRQISAPSLSRTGSGGRRGAS
jgi:hypothetical protein